MLNICLKVPVTDEQVADTLLYTIVHFLQVNAFNFLHFSVVLHYFLLPHHWPHHHHHHHHHQFDVAFPSECGKKSKTCKNQSKFPVFMRLRIDLKPPSQEFNCSHAWKFD